MSLHYSTGYVPPPTSIAMTHYHKTEDGLLVKCYHNCRSLLTDWKFALGVTVSFPIEHFLWTKVWPFYELAEVLGLISGH